MSTLTTHRHWHIQVFDTSQCAHMRDDIWLDLCTDPADV
jgi:hypothetical protein